MAEKYGDKPVRLVVGGEEMECAPTDVESGTTRPWRVGEWQEGERYEYEPRIPVYDNAGGEIFNITADDKPDDAKSVAAVALANEIVKAVNMHDRLVAYVKDNMPKCMHRCKNGPSCDGCDTVCEEGALLQEARATNLPGLTAEESALVREHKAEIARGDK